MASDLEKLIEKLPTADGTLRRRVLSGSLVIFSAVLLYPSNIESILVEKGIKAADLIKSPSVLFVIFSLIYAIGGLIELLGRLYIIRSAGEAIQYIAQIKQKSKSSNIFISCIKYLLYSILAIYWIYVPIIKGLIGHTSYRISLDRSSLSKDAANFYRNLPDKVKKGLSEPLGDSADYAWEAVENRLNERQQKTVRKKNLRNFETLSILITLLFIFILSLPKLQETFFEDEEASSVERIIAQIDRDRRIKLLHIDNKIRADIVSSEEGKFEREEIIENAKQKHDQAWSEYDKKRREAIQREVAFTISMQIVLFLIFLLFRGYFINLKVAIVDILEFASAEANVENLKS